MKTKLLFLAVVCCLLLQGCISGFQQYYQKHVFETYAPTKDVCVFGLTEENLQSAMQDGYIVIGESNFNGPYERESLAITQAKKVGADIVLVGCQQTGTEQGVVPFTQYNPGQTTTVHSFGHASGSAYGPGGSVYGSATGFGTSYITSPGYTTTQFVPYSVEKYDHHAIFLRKPRQEESNALGGKPDTLNKVVTKADAGQKQLEVRDVDIKQFTKIIVDLYTNINIAGEEAFLGWSLTVSPHSNGLVPEKWKIDTNISKAIQKFKKGHEELLGINCSDEKAKIIRNKYLEAYKYGLNGSEMMLKGFEKSSILQKRPPDWEMIYSGEKELNKAHDIIIKTSLNNFKLLVQENSPESIDDMLPEIRVPFIFNEEDLKNAPYLGVSHLTSRREILVRFVDDKSPAQEADIKILDVILGEEGGEKLPTAIEFRRFLIKHKPGDVVKLEIMRDGKKIVKTVTLGEKPKEKT